MFVLFLIHSGEVHGPMHMIRTLLIPYVLVQQCGLYRIQGKDESTDALMSQQHQVSIKVSTHLRPISKLISCGQSFSKLMDHDFK